MHESILARQILELVLERSGSQVQQILCVKGWIAETEALTPEALQFHFSAHAANTTAEKARLDLRLSRVSAHCNQCGTDFQPEHHLALCPECGGTDATLQGKTGLGIETIEYR